MYFEFYLGPGSSSLDHRAVKVINLATGETVYEQNLAGTTETQQIDLPTGGVFQLQLVDRAHGYSGQKATLNFNTNQSGVAFMSGAGLLRLMSVEDESSSSTSSRSSSSSSPSSSSTSSLSSGTSMSSSSSSSPSSLSSTSSPTSASSSSSSSTSKSSSSSSISSSSSSSLSSSSLSSSSSSSN